MAMVYLVSDTFSVNQQCHTRVLFNEIGLKNSRRMVGYSYNILATMIDCMSYQSSSLLQLAGFVTQLVFPPPVACRVPSSTVNTSH